MGPAGRATHERLGDAVIMTHEADSFVPHGEMLQLRVENNIKRTLEVREAKIEALNQWQCHIKCS